MKTSIFLTSFFSMYSSGSNPRTSPAICVANCDASNFVMVSIPLRPAPSAAQFASVPIPSDDTRPMPVTTTRRLLVIPYFLLFACESMYSTASLTRVIFSASSSGISIPNSSSNAITSSTVSSESAPRSSTNDASGVTSSSSTPSCSTMMLFTLSATATALLLHVHPAVDGQNVPSNIRCLVGSKKTRGGRHIVGRTTPTERNLGCPVDLRLLADRARHLRVDHARRDDVHRDPARRDFPREGLHQADQPGFGCGVIALPGIPRLPHDRAHRDDAPAPLLQHRADDGLGKEEGGCEVRRDYGVPVLS